ncbi:hypothetical protein PALI_a1166 [Pseudoalteromonas aliena SW19]|jgi:hypothetical protein|uniref:Uncharacterized protein n=1 Tax=Pseudoalteromonas aliena SW19 TaxID=1314866 RepID=A0ABR9DZW3_9GAMM|nr:hypothetical protein [Pseudoalteromonas aliena SW19]
MLTQPITKLSKTVLCKPFGPTFSKSDKPLPTFRFLCDLLQF